MRIQNSIPPCNLMPLTGVETLVNGSTLLFSGAKEIRRFGMEHCLRV